MTFNWIHYKELNPDLINSIGSNERILYNHYIKHGKNENRKCNIYMEYPDFNWKQYRNNYIDLSKFNKDRLENHWIVFGRIENRTYKNITYELYPDFSWIQYKKNYNTNNKLITEEDCTTHWLHYGSKNNLTYLKIEVKKKEVIDKTKKYILVIDLPSKFKGGTNFFIQNIIKNYMNVVSFLTIRNNDNFYDFYINDIMEPSYHIILNNALELLEEYKDNIIKIFVNHMMNYNNLFINKLFKMNKHITIITHDFYSITSNCNPYYEDINKYERKNIILSKFDMIITQNKKNLLIFNKYIRSTQNTVVIPLPDYYKSVSKIEMDSNKKITVVFIGHISTFKGSNRIKNIIKKYNKIYDFVIFGSININEHIKNYTYNSIEELNNLFILYQPNIIIETSIAPETYSYTLTLMMLTQLPIIFFKKTFESVIEDRLNNYMNAHMIDKIEGLDKIITNKKQDYFFTIDSTLYYDTFWNNYFSE